MTRDLEAATRAYRRAQRAQAQRREELAQAIVRAISEGVRQSEVCRVTGYTRERIRQIVRTAEGGADPKD